METEKGIYCSDILSSLEPIKQTTKTYLILVFCYAGLESGNFVSSKLPEYWTKTEFWSCLAISRKLWYLFKKESFIKTPEKEY